VAQQRCLAGQNIISTNIHTFILSEAKHVPNQRFYTTHGRIQRNNVRMLMFCFYFIAVLRIQYPDPTIFCHPGSRILYKKEKCKISLKFFLPDQMITVANDHTKFYFSSFSIFFKGINFIIYQFYYLKFNFGHV
jgi:hypothetical protein